MSNLNIPIGRSIFVCKPYRLRPAADDAAPPPPSSAPPAAAASVTARSMPATRVTTTTTQQQQQHYAARDTSRVRWPLARGHARASNALGVKPFYTSATYQPLGQLAAEWDAGRAHYDARVAEHARYLATERLPAAAAATDDAVVALLAASDKTAATRHRRYSSATGTYGDLMAAELELTPLPGGTRSLDEWPVMSTELSGLAYELSVGGGVDRKKRLRRFSPKWQAARDLFQQALAATHEMHWQATVAGGALTKLALLMGGAAGAMANGQDRAATRTDEEEEEEDDEEEKGEEATVVATPAVGNGDGTKRRATIGDE